MERLVSVLRDRRAGFFLVNPMGTYKGYGAYVGLSPYKEIAAKADPNGLGEVVTEMLARSGPTGVPFREAKAQQKATSDTETVRIRRKYLDRLKTTEQLSRRFLRARVTTSDQKQSWLITVFRFDPKRESLVGQKEEIRIKKTEGATGLGEALLQVLPVE